MNSTTRPTVRATLSRVKNRATRRLRWLRLDWCTAVDLAQRCQMREVVDGGLPPHACDDYCHHYPTQCTRCKRTGVGGYSVQERR